MDTYDSLKNELLDINKDISDLISNAKAMPGMGDQIFRGWEKISGDIREQVSEEMLRVAVVGAIKSGKSTFVNSLFKGDYLKRGAGVVTSIVTRIHRGNALRAKLCFKSWQDVNAEIEKALVLFPNADWRSEGDKGFDIRSENDRAELAQALESLKEDLLITNDTLNTDSVLLNAYLKGYDTVREILSEETVTRRQYEGDLFAEHKDFVGDDTLAVYLDDVRLEINAGEIDGNIEIADCQGSDSPNPLHLAMIQEYLRLTHMIVYVISSRTGLRQADIKFLSAIKQMGIIDNAIFLVNFDFGEHDSVEDLTRVVEKIRQELALIRPDPDLYVLSALFNLFRVTKKDLSVKDNLRLAQWKGEMVLADFSDEETTRFEAAIHRKLTRERYALLLSNHFERLGVIASGLEYWATASSDILTKDAYDVAGIIDGIKQHQKKTDRIRSVIHSTLEGAVRKIKKSLRTDIDRFFDVKYGTPANLIRFIRGYDVPFSKYEGNIGESGFSNTMYLIFQEVKRATDLFMAESVNPDVIRFIGEKEEDIREHFVTVGRPYDVMVRDALSEYSAAMESIGIPAVQNGPDSFELEDISVIRERAGLKLPSVFASIHYTSTVKTEAVMRLGFYQIAYLFKKLFRKPVQSQNEGEMLALRDGVKRLKRETEKSLVFNFKDYRENIKFQYVFKLVDAVSDYLYHTLMNRFEAYTSDLSNIAELVREKRIDKDQALKMLGEIKERCWKNRERIARAKEEILAADS